MSGSRNTIAIRASDMAVGKPLPWSVFDENGRLLLNKGMAPSSQAQIDVLAERGLYRQSESSAEGKGSKPDIPPVGLGPTEEDKNRLKGDPIPFDDLAMQPGEILQMRTVLEVVADDMPVVLVGYLKNRSIVVSAPMAAGKPLLPKDGSLFNVKTFSGTCLFTFRTRLLVSYA